VILQLFCWGFTVDDAWIVSRVAAHGIEKGFFAFNAAGPETDAVTPFGFARFLAALGRLFQLERPLELFALSRWLGLGAALGSFVLASVLAVRDQKRKKWWLPALLVPLALPASIWAGAGLSTPIVGLLIIGGGALVERRGMRGVLGAILLGLGVAWRPELGPAASALMVSVRLKTANARDVVQLATGFVSPLVLVGLLRFLSYSSFLPLSFVAKAPDFGFGLRYAVVSLIWGGLPWVLLLGDKPSALKSASSVWIVHLVALVFAGGDWMPALRLSAPLYPWLLWKLASRLGEGASSWRRLFLLPALYGPLVLLWQQGSDFRKVTERRLALVDAAREPLRGSRTVAAVDVGWVGLATDAHLVDLAGVTDPKVAALSGGHTSKEIYPGLFSAREVDTWVIRALDTEFHLGQPLEEIHAAYWVDARLLARNKDLGFDATALVALRGSGGQYIIATRRAER
jgi:hypothetical protein